MSPLMPWEKRKAREAAQATAESGKELTTAADEPDTGLASRIAGKSPAAADETLAEARLVPHHLLVQLRNYPRLRNLVLAFLLVQERFEWLGRVRSSLQRAGAEPDTDFWEGLQGEFGGMGLRPEFPNRLLAGDDASQEFTDLVQEFDERYGNVATAAEAALNPNQSARSAQEALEHVSAMRSAALKLITKCREQAQTLLDDLYETVNMIFAGEPRPSASDDRDKAIGHAAGDFKLPDTARDDDDDFRARLKHVSSTADVQGHLLTRRREPHE
jgi:cell division septum initiation protein DivIVA